MSESTKPITHLIPARWAFEGLLLLENENREFPRNPNEDLSRNPGAVDYFFPERDRFGTAATAVILGAMLVALIVGIMTILKIRDIH